MAFIFGVHLGTVFSDRLEIFLCGFELHRHGVALVWCPVIPQIVSKTFDQKGLPCVENDWKTISLS
jgi:hypothetical protein